MRSLNIAAFCLVLALPGWSQSPNLAITFEQLRQTMMSRSKEFEAARERLRQAEAALTQARLRRNPSLDLSATTDVLFANEGERGYSVTYSHPLELGGKRSKRIEVAEAFVEVTKAEIANTERELTHRLWSLFVAAIEASARAEILRTSSQVNERLSDVMEVRLRSGDASRLDARLLTAQTNQLVAQQLQSESQLTTVLFQLRNAAGMAPQETLTLAVFPQRAADRLSLNEAVTLALGTRPDLRAARLREEWSEAGIDFARSQAVPNAALLATYARESQIRQLATPSQKRTFEQDSVMTFGVSIPLPFFDRQQGNIAEAVSRRSQVRAEREGLEQLVRSEVLSAYQRYETSRRSLDLMRTGVMDQAQESFQIVQLSQRLGELRLVDVLNQQRFLLDTQLVYLTVQKDFYSALGELEIAIGRMSDFSTRE